jgi:hypothetical protein
VQLCCNVSSSCDCVMPPTVPPTTSGSRGQNVRSSGPDCPVERAGMSGRVGRDVRLSGQGCPVEWAGMSVERAARSSAGHRRDVRPAGFRLQQASPIGRTGRAKRLHGPSQPVRGALAPGGRDISAHSTRLLRPVGGTSLPTPRDFCARWAGHLCPLDATFAPAGRDISNRSAGVQRIRSLAVTSRPAPRPGRPAARSPG